MHDLLFDTYPVDFKKANLTYLGEKYECGKFKVRIDECRLKNMT
jgi:hypothetical protein